VIFLYLDLLIYQNFNEKCQPIIGVKNMSQNKKIVSKQLLFMVMSDTEKSKGSEVGLPLLVLTLPSGNTRKPPRTSPKPVMKTIYQREEIAVGGSEQALPCFNRELALSSIICILLLELII